ncbi:MAG: hypothetical protein ACRDTJ_17695, partial [Pseudonocardiaceae bacterium]
LAALTRTQFRTTRFDLDHLVKNMDRGDVALPDLQRPFGKVRDLLDSMLKDVDAPRGTLAGGRE